MRKILIIIFNHLFYGALSYKKNEYLQSSLIGKLLDPYTYYSKINITGLAIKLNSGQKVLDIGSGGQWARHIFEKSNIAYTGCDIRDCVSPEKQDFFVTDARLPVAENTFDLVISNSVLEHIDTPEIAVSEANRVLKPGGLFYCQTNFLYQEHGNPSDYYRFTLNGLSKLMERNNFSVESSAKIGDFSTFIIDNIAAYVGNRMSNLLVQYFRFNRFFKTMLFGLGLQSHHSINEESFTQKQEHHVIGKAESNVAEFDIMKSTR
jgi:SAM-dependent methyltransferase